MYIIYMHTYIYTYIYIHVFIIYMHVYILRHPTPRMPACRWRGAEQRLMCYMARRVNPSAARRAPKSI